MRVTAPTEIREPEDLAFLSTAHQARKRLEVDLTDVAWISPLGAVAVLATCLRADTSALDTTVVYLPENRGVRTYLHQIGLLAELAKAEWVLTKLSSPEDVAVAQTEMRDRPELTDIDIDPDVNIGPHLPVSRLTTEREVDVAAEKLDDALREAQYIPGGLADELKTVALELTSNAREHGSPCYGVAQMYTGQRSGTPGIQLAVADFGEGFARTLRRHYGKMADDEAIVLAFEEQISGTGRSARGFGLTQILEIVDREPRNVLHVISKSGHVVRSRGEFRIASRETLLFRGTLASAYLPHGSL